MNTLAIHPHCLSHWIGNRNVLSRRRRFAWGRNLLDAFAMDAAHLYCVARINGLLHHSPIISNRFNASRLPKLRTAASLAFCASLGVVFSFSQL